MSEHHLTPGQAAILAGLPTEPGPAQVPHQPPSTGTAIARLNDQELADLIGMLLDEQQERALSAADPAALIDDGFKRLFTSRGDALDPELTGGILVCAGSLRQTATTSHVCTFAVVDDDWCWEHPDILEDSVRKVEQQGRDHQRSITLIPATEGTKVDLVTSRMTIREGHRAQKTSSYVVRQGRLEMTQTRSTPKPGMHR